MDKKYNGDRMKQEQIAKGMGEVRIEKVVVSMGATGERLERAVKLLKLITGRKPCKRKAKRRIPSLGVRPKMEIGAMVTVRGKEAEQLLARLLEAIDKKLKKKQISDGTFSFGIDEYIEIPGMEYQRDIGVMGLDVSVAFYKPGKRVALKKIKRGKLPKKQRVSKEEIIKFLEEKFGVEVK